MAKRVIRSVDQTRTELLAIDELFVLKGEGDAGHYIAFLYDYNVPPECCPVCGETRLKAHNLFPRTYTDYIMEENTPRVIELEYRFYKYRCLNPDCGRVFPADISFASVNSKVTNRMENKIADAVIR